MLMEVPHLAFSNLCWRRQKSYRNNSDKYNDRRKRSPKREVAKGVMYNRNQRQKIEQKRERQRQYKRGSRHKAILSRRQLTFIILFFIIIIYSVFSDLFYIFFLSKFIVPK
jgi:Flp pilus assembly protein TadB